jgi:hypothetical protein
MTHSIFVDYNKIKRGGNPYASVSFVVFPQNTEDE